MSELSVIAAPMNCSRAGKVIGSRFSACSLLLLILCFGVLRPSAAECAPKPRTADLREPSALNLLGIRYAKGQGVKKNPRLAMRLFLRSASNGYSPAMANLGTLYEMGEIGHADFARAYAWVRAALSFGLSEEDHDETVLKLWVIAARLGPNRIEGAERLADAIVIRIVETCQCAPGQEPELASIDFL
jgi:TPR repeat protein